ncbi:hypothetical protein ARMSODRAFT_541390 [Armillaria solidipes]|uniref:Uncharacterized protein n=1 Tax=Armillaria solidipes TaxID=1076256 RepID=A0A2H3BBF9_9AGAR|nr:hypothetical protein ARMSODRAFT_541390 [Armillaria solidipes]
MDMVSLMQRCVRVWSFYYLLFYFITEIRSFSRQRQVFGPLNDVRLGFIELQHHCAGFLRYIYLVLSDLFLPITVLDCRKLS